MKDSKNLVIGLLCVVVCIMAVAYAAFATTLNINGTASIDSRWGVAITDIQCTATEVEGGEAAAVTKGFTATTATFSMTFNQPGDTGRCVVTITNTGTLNAKVSAIDIADEENLATGPIKYTLSGITVGTKLAKSSTNTYTINASYDSTVTTQPTEAEASKTLTVSIEYVQDLTA